MMLLYVALLAVVCAAVPATVWLKREGEREWMRELDRRHPPVHVVLTADTAAFEAALRGMAEAARRMGEQIESMRPAFARAGRELSRALRHLNGDRS